METKERGYSAHVIVFPYPSQGHINPMLQFAKRLASKGLKITVATTHYAVKSIHASGVSVEPISDGYDQSGFWQAPSADAYVAEFKATGSRTLTELIQKLDRLGSPVDCVVYDSLLGWVQNVTRQLGVRGAIFFTNSSYVCSIFCRLHHGLLSLPLSPDAMPLTLPGLVPLSSSELPTFLTGVVYPAYWNMVMNQFAGLDKVDWVFGNTFERLDGQDPDSKQKHLLLFKHEEQFMMAGKSSLAEYTTDLIGELMSPSSVDPIMRYVLYPNSLSIWRALSKALAEKTVDPKIKFHAAERSEGLNIYH